MQSVSESTRRIRLSAKNANDYFSQIINSTTMTRKQRAKSKMFLKVTNFPIYLKNTRHVHFSLRKNLAATIKPS